MVINFVMGPAASGKSTFIKNTFPNLKIIDLLDYQEDFMTIKTVMKSYEDVLNDLLKTIKNNEDVVLEHTLLKKIRRKYYIDAIKEITDAPINCYLIKPDIEEYKKFYKERKLPLEMLENSLEILELPTTEEGFQNVYIIKPIL